MTGTKPPAGFEHFPLDIETVSAGRRFGRIYASAFPDPLGYGKTPSRFSDPRRRDAARQFGVLYLDETLKVCFLEAILRDRRDGLIGDLPIEEKEIYARRYAEIETRRISVSSICARIMQLGWECRPMLRGPLVSSLRERGRLRSTNTNPCRTASSIHPV
jgi:hypothetical protein